MANVRSLQTATSYQQQRFLTAKSEEKKLVMDGPHAPEMVMMNISAIARSGMIALKASCCSDNKANSPQIRHEKPCDADQKNKNCRSNLLTNLKNGINDEFACSEKKLTDLRPAKKGRYVIR